MKISLQLKIVAIYLSVIVIMMMVIGTFIIYNIEERDYRSIQQNLETVANGVQMRIDWPTVNWRINEKTLTDMKEKADIINTNLFMYILDEDGRVRIGTSSDYMPGDTVASEVVIRAIQGKQPATAQIVHFASKSINDKKMTDHARPIIDPVTGDIKAIIYVAASTEKVYENMIEVLKTITLGSLVAMVVTGLFGIVFSKMITDPIKQLTSSAKKLAAGDYIRRIPIESNDEIGELTQSFNYMATQLGNTMAAITTEKNKLEKIFEHMADGVMAFNRQGVLVHANSVCYEMLGSLNMDHRFAHVFP